MTRKWLFLLCLCIGLFACGGNTTSSQQPGASRSNYIQNKGSDTMVNLALAWAEQYQHEHPEVQISVTGGGSGTGLSALLNGTVDIANASRAIQPEEVKRAKDEGFTPVEFTVARDAIGVIVNPANPVHQMTMQQISKIFRGEYNNWKQVGGDDRPIVRVSRETNSGTHVYFLETVVRLGNAKDKTIFAPDTLLLPSSEGIISEVSDNPNAIGYDGLGYITPQVKTLAIARDDHSAYVLPSVESVNAKTYPIARDLYMYTHDQPTGVIKTYIDWIYSPEAQQTVTQLGFIPYQQTQK
jgi:phosphate transport system substrate-binding protein